MDCFLLYGALIMLVLEAAAAAWRDGAPAAAIRAVARILAKKSNIMTTTVLGAAAAFLPLAAVGY